MDIKLQSQFISYILLGLIIVGIASGLYLWGIPVVQKNTINSQIQNIQDQFISLAQSIQNVGINGGQVSINLYIPQGSLIANPNKIEYTIQIPNSNTYYNPSLKEVPINYEVYYPCSGNNSLSVGEKINLCNYPGLYAYMNSNYIIVNDSIYNSSVIIPLSNLENSPSGLLLITSGYVFNVELLNKNVLFIPLYNTGIYGNPNYPACIVNAVQQGNIIEYTLQCRPLYDQENGICYWIQIQPQGTSSLTGNGIAQISYQGATISNQYLSTICKVVEIKTVDISL